MHKLLSTLFVGTWKLDPAKTKYTTGEPPKELTLVTEEQGDNFQVTATGTNSDGAPFSVKYIVPVKGGPGQMQEGPFDSVSSKIISTDVREITFGKGEMT
ncbi:MAG: hypothetical protein JO150_07105 [Acidobacteriaceae bacterium]|nr:hypothetical protein [Acidobacteriaceae bacterium]MBV9938250.1 hypothetical protein [Acidobacteriaceae bacterium]